MSFYRKEDRRRQPSWLEDRRFGNERRGRGDAETNDGFAGGRRRRESQERWDESGRKRGRRRDAGLDRANRHHSEVGGRRVVDEEQGGRGRNSVRQGQLGADGWKRGGGRLDLGGRGYEDGKGVEGGEKEKEQIKPKRTGYVTLDELKRRALEDEERLAKPVFLSKEERRLQAVARLAEKRATEREQVKKKRESSGRSLNNGNRSKLTGGPEQQNREFLRDEYFDRGRARRSRSNNNKSNGAVVVGGALTGVSKPVFDWDETEDTTQSAEPIVDGINVSRLWSDLYFKKPRAGVKNIDDEKQVGRRMRKSDFRHWTGKPLKDMTERDWRIFREDNRISVRGGSFRLARNWEETGLPGEILDAITYPHPTPIQMAAIPIALAKRDLIGLAQTGSGKTAAFVLPMLDFLLQRSLARGEGDDHDRGPYSIILAPTRELVNQIVQECESLTRNLNLRVVAVVGGFDIEKQGSELQKGCDIVAATPGRMMDVLDRRYVVLSAVTFVVLDEADRMVDMGFAPQVNRVLEGVGPRQVMMFSATMPQQVEGIVKEYMKRPIVIKVGDRGMTGEDVEQKVEFFGSVARKRQRLGELISQLQGSIIVFANTKRGVDDAAKFIESNSGKSTVVLHSSKSQDQRTENLERFKNGRVSVLVATDVMGRGIDVKGVEHVVNFEVPTEIDKYTHRIGRTGRAGHKGIAWTLVTKEDEGIFGDLTTVLEKAGAKVPREVQLASKDALRNGYGRAITE
eukprot:Plantae.Rhodophyta-Hildenbrandia_rubra.ctg11534.p1 GENE.Plantae.Rhodophyta-Hildenbrandia_rubra.ctg11534~~Plantae.Rhodophyta-Hildenbrandia_rubra.ctg11534.p1  ORF type:complete len:741 (-),score=164.32 Plantae.Rhodophyta-Hildenbrandia_rubra.ctg11534:1399-3621(-)